MPTAIEPVTILIDKDSQPDLFQEDPAEDTPQRPVLAFGAALIGAIAWRRTRPQR